MNLDLFIAFSTNYYHHHSFSYQNYHFESLFIQPFSYRDISPFSINSFFNSKTKKTTNPSLFQTQKTQEQNKNVQKIQRKEIESIRIQTKDDSKKDSQNRKKEKKFQKDSRNVVSNLLKIFFKNLLELQKWEKFIKSLIKKHNYGTSVQSFYQWITGFKINYKNYIQIKEIKKLLSVRHSQNHLVIFRTLLKHFTQSFGVVHCLTARRIQRRAILGHIRGLRVIETLIQCGLN